MACRTEIKTIGDNEYSVTQWNVEKAAVMKFRLIEAFGAAFLTLAKYERAGDYVKGASEVVETFFKTNNPEKTWSLIKECIVGVAMNGKRLSMESIIQTFGGDDLMEIYKIFFFVIQVNYKNFMKGQHLEGMLTEIQKNL